MRFSLYTYVTFGRHVQEIVILHVSVPVVQRRATDGDPHERADHVHQGVGQFTVLAMVKTW